MRVQMDRRLLAAALLGVVALMLFRAAMASEGESDAPAVKLADFGRYESKPLIASTYVNSPDLATTNVRSVIESVVSAKVKQWNADGILRGERTLAMSTTNIFDGQIGVGGHVR